MKHYAFLSFVKKRISSSMLLLIATVAALAIANSPWREGYKELWDLPINLSIGNISIFSIDGNPMLLGAFINDFLMAIFFLSVGLEIKREMLCGELSSVKKALAPVIGACGGMLLPVIVFLAVCPDNADMQRGMAIPMATDIAFSLGCLSVFSKRCPTSLKMFLAALAVADDLGGIIVIAIKYTEELNTEYLALAALTMVVLIAGNKRNIREKKFYLGFGLLLWYSFMNSGIHATISGVVLAFCVPANLPKGTKKYLTRIQDNLKLFPVIKVTHADHNKPIVLSHDDVNVLKSIESASDHLISPLQDMEDNLASVVNYIIIPLFAFACAGIDFTGMGFSNLFSGVGLSVFLGLFVGKFLGVLFISWLCIKLKIIQMPHHATWPAFASVCMICGIGFTVSMFMANLSYPVAQDSQYLVLLNDAKLGILCGSIISAIVGCIMLHFTLPKEQELARLQAEEKV